jgi:NAD(P)-dependent dehydrogenase (short-subunit alcohol dehydrogenase family)
MASGLVQLWKQKNNPPRQPSSSFKGQIIIVTGANVGLGFEAAVKFVELGAARVILGVRSLEKGAAAKDAIELRTGRKECVEVWQLDMASYDSITAFAKRAEDLDHLDIAVLNAGVYKFKFESSKYGYEQDIQVNAISTTLLGLLLLPILKKSSTESHKAVISFVSSGLHQRTSATPEQRHLLEKLNTPEKFKSSEQYGFSKLLLMCAVLSMAQDANNAGVKITSVCPGMCNSDLSRDLGFVASIFKYIFFRIFARTSEEGARAYITSTTDGDNGGFWKNDQNQK